MTNRYFIFIAAVFGCLDCGFFVVQLTQLGLWVERHLQIEDMGLV